MAEEQSNQGAGRLKDPAPPVGVAEGEQAVAWGYPSDDSDHPGRSRSGPHRGELYSVVGPTGLRLWYVGSDLVDPSTARPIAPVEPVAPPA